MGGLGEGGIVVGAGMTGNRAFPGTGFLSPFISMPAMNMH